MPTFYRSTIESSRICVNIDMRIGCVICMERCQMGRHGGAAGGCVSATAPLPRRDASQPCAQSVVHHLFEQQLLPPEHHSATPLQSDLQWRREVIALRRTRAFVSFPGPTIDESDRRSSTNA